MLDQLTYRANGLTGLTNGSVLITQTRRYGTQAVDESCLHSTYVSSTYLGRQKFTHLGRYPDNAEHTHKTEGADDSTAALGGVQ